jgi:hypothetical protein
MPIIPRATQTRQLKPLLEVVFFCFMDTVSHNLNSAGFSTHDEAGDLTFFLCSQKKITVAVPRRNFTGFSNNFLLRPRASPSGPVARHKGDSDPCTK